ncbi:hypothetical protein RWA06_04575 [Sinorhizobium meliloti]|uniref:hypothetical protein n=1 Tax=Rhizobium meliloti TaxID=382 RepID=UPI00299D681F|nr:hypothetical protein [Sinorhizobium meliloti]MDX1222699.1 hypothetical protein [Sinorhizobium medicae]
MAPAKQIKIRLEFDYWGADGARIPAGTVVSLPEKEAAAVVNLGKAKIALDD